MKRRDFLGVVGGLPFAFTLAKPKQFSAVDAEKLKLIYFEEYIKTFRNTNNHRLFVKTIDNKRIWLPSPLHVNKEYLKRTFINPEMILSKEIKTTKLGLVNQEGYILDENNLDMHLQPEDILQVSFTLMISL